MGSFLDDLLADARRRVTQAIAREPLAELRERAALVPAPPSFHDALARPGVGVIAEVKRASPSKGDLAPGLDAVDQAERYAKANVAAISVLTEPDRFKGSLDDLRAVSALGTPTIRKDFVVDPYQVWEARAAGASAVLLIVAALDRATLGSLSTEAAEAGLDVLTEVHDEAELETARAVGARIIGVNARDLRTFAVDRDAFGRLRPGIPGDVLAVAESGIRGPQDVTRAAQEGADAVLVGEALVTAADPHDLATRLVTAGSAAATSR